MKWKTPKNGDERIIKKFLWFPLVLVGEKRWLEKVEITQLFNNGKWSDLKFVEKEDETSREGIQ